MSSTGDIGYVHFDEAKAQLMRPLSAEPRQRDATLTREAILKAAQALFACKGYDAASTREISALAGSDPVLIRRYFGSKRGLFREALDQSFDMEPVLGGERDRIGERVSRSFARPEGLPLSLSMIILSSSDLEVRSIGRELLRKRVVDALQIWMGKGQGHNAALRLLALWTGFYITREIMALDEEAQDSVGDLVLWVGSQTQLIVDGHDDHAVVRRESDSDRSR
jgi:AcrR family transcriptional regulator